MSEITDFLAREVKLLEQNTVQHIGRYRSVGHFVLVNGRNWTPQRKPKGVKWQELKNCFGNATLMSIFDPKEYIYCEGYALGSAMWPMLHAWCLTPAGEIIDTTWRKPGHEYYGIAIKHSYLTAAMSRQKNYGLIDNWEGRWPMLSADPRLWRHAINDLERSRDNRYARAGRSGTGDPAPSKPC